MGNLILISDNAALQSLTMSVHYHPKQMNSTLTSFDKVSTSSAIHKFTFSKDSRFKDIKIAHHRIGYELPSAIRQGRGMGVGFGFGERTKGRKADESPSPDRYDIGSFIDKFDGKE